MNTSSQDKGYQPGFYGKKRMTAIEWAESHIRKYTEKQETLKEAAKGKQLFPTVCFSRRIGVGALEIADLLAQILHCRVIDREILEHMAKDTQLSEKMVAFYDERYSGKMSELFSMLISERTFLKSDYARQLARTVTALAYSEPSIFVGRGAHLILPRKSVLAVRFVCSREFRVDRLARMMAIGMSEAEKQLDVLDAEQREFFKAVYQKKEARPDEFDLVICRDHLQGADQAARIVACAFERKFGKIEGR